MGFSLQCTLHILHNICLFLDPKYCFGSGLDPDSIRSADSVLSIGPDPTKKYKKLEVSCFLRNGYSLRRVGGFFASTAHCQRGSPHLIAQKTRGVYCIQTSNKNCFCFCTSSCTSLSFWTLTSGSSSFPSGSKDIPGVRLFLQAGTVPYCTY